MTPAFPFDPAVEQLKKLLIDSWRSGRRERVEQLLDAVTLTRLNSDGLLELLRLEYSLATEAGEPVSAADYAVRFPALANRLERMLLLEGESATAMLAATVAQTNEPKNAAIVESMTVRTEVQAQPRANGSENESGDSEPVSDRLTQTDITHVERLSNDPAQSTAHDESMPPRCLERPGRLRAGDCVDDFDLLLELGSGAFADVFLARQRSMQRIVALKVSVNHTSEPQTLAQLDHDHIVRVFDLRVVSGRKLRLLYMQYVAGGTLQNAVAAVASTAPAVRSGRLLLHEIDSLMRRRGEDKPLGSANRRRIAHMTWPETVCHLGAQIASALAYAHERGVIHRDIKPANILLTAEGSPKLADFNISYAAGVEGTSAAAYFGGSLAYMSPEQMEASLPSSSVTPKDLDGRSDIYALGVVLWELLIGERPWPHESATGEWTELVKRMASRRRQGVPPLPKSMSTALPDGLEEILARCLQPKREDRYQSAEEVERELRLCLEPELRALLRPDRQSLLTRLRRMPYTTVLFLILIPNVISSIFNIHFNATELSHRLPDALSTFISISLVINSIAFPLGIGVITLFIWPVIRAVRINPKQPTTGLDPMSEETASKLRQRCLRMGVFSGLIILALWVGAGPAFPFALHVLHGDVPTSLYVIFFVSLTISGLIAAVYPFFAASWLAVRSFYPVLIPSGQIGDDDLKELRRLSTVSWIAMALAACVPMLAVTLLVTSGLKAQLTVGILAAGGCFGFAVIAVFFRTLQRDLNLLITAHDLFARRSDDED
ncbi:MAG: serine/threonine-protein kinase [Pirellulales bacterium]